MSKKQTVVGAGEIVSLSDLGFKHGQLDATLGSYAEYALKVFGSSFPTMKRNDPDHAEKVGELASGYLSYWATLPRNTPTVYIIVEAGQTATWVPETPANKDAKGERVEITAHTVMAHSQQAFGKFKNADASADVMPKSWQTGYHAIAEKIRKGFSTYLSKKFSDLQAKAREIQNPDSTPRSRSATLDQLPKIKKTQDAMLKSCKVAKGRGDVTAYPDRMELGFTIFNEVYGSAVPVETIRSAWSKMLKDLK